ncbi:uncharacterized protein EV154DRAFT_514516 [Mucor mucedo]|uniref:uncharacterized protein n=1 Tax=Mucor mucedo TaxID=29922 RepID=UPI00221EA048|nr:uncharacterized protein EV154DRAFT_514516 [Mucor mucedo]KAI7889527.1 hypothetical protein EV154DRAFT_514516 [Mucor mucedo]
MKKTTRRPKRKAAAKTKPISDVKEELKEPSVTWTPLQLEQAELAKQLETYINEFKQKLQWLNFKPTNRELVTLFVMNLHPRFKRLVEPLVPTYATWEDAAEFSRLHCTRISVILGCERHDSDMIFRSPESKALISSGYFISNDSPAKSLYPGAEAVKHLLTATPSLPTDPTSESESYSSLVIAAEDLSTGEQTGNISGEPKEKKKEANDEPVKDEEASKLNDEEASKVNNEELSKVPNNNTFEEASEDASKVAIEDAFKVTMKETYIATNEEMDKATNEETDKVTNEETSKVVVEETSKAIIEEKFKADIEETDIEETVKADIEKTDKADIEKTDKADVEKTDKADIEKTDKIVIEKTDKVVIEETDKVVIEETSKLITEETSKENNKETSKVNEGTGVFDNDSNQTKQEETRTDEAVHIDAKKLNDTGTSKDINQDVEEHKEKQRQDTKVIPKDKKTDDEHKSNTDTILNEKTDDRPTKEVTEKKDHPSSMTKSAVQARIQQAVKNKKEREKKLALPKGATSNSSTNKSICYSVPDEHAAVNLAFLELEVNGKKVKGLLAKLRWGASAMSIPCAKNLGLTINESSSFCIQTDFGIEDTIGYLKMPIIHPADPDIKAELNVHILPMIYGGKVDLVLGADFFYIFKPTLNIKSRAIRFLEKETPYIVSKIE